MPRLVVKLAPEKYVVWSTVVDAPVNYIVSTFDAAMDEWAAGSVFWRPSVRDLDWMSTDGRRNCETGGVSVARWTTSDLISHNRAGDGETHLSLGEILSEYDQMESDQ
jgi:hypothetical protein